jgi:hypothetical protein
MDPAIAGFLGGLVGGLAVFLVYLLQRMSDKSAKQQELVAAVRAIRSELVRNANALSSGSPAAISAEYWARYSGDLAGAEKIGPVVLPWDDLDAAYFKLRLIAEGRTSPSSTLAVALRDLADQLLDVAAKAFDVALPVPLPAPPLVEGTEHPSAVPVRVPPLGRDVEHPSVVPAPASPTAGETEHPSVVPGTAFNQLPVSHEVERAIASRRVGRARRVRKALNASSIYGLGTPAGDTSIPGYGTESNLVHFYIDSRGHDYAMLPVFTRGFYLASALAANREWLGTAVMRVDGGPLLKNRSKEANLVINPGSPLEMIVPAKSRGERFRSE